MCDINFHDAIARFTSATPRRLAARKREPENAPLATPAIENHALSLPVCFYSLVTHHSAAGTAVFATHNPRYYTIRHVGRMCRMEPR